MNGDLRLAEALQQLTLPDPWQSEAIRALSEGSDLVVQAPTGAGKTFIFEQYFQQHRLRGQAIYTVPTRALANDKFAEWQCKGWNVGITTGDLSYRPGAPLVVATLEAQQSPAQAALYVVDEYQWLGDERRGNHYEGVILSLPARTQLLLLSGSVANPGDVAAWLERLGRRVHLVHQHQRPVPLEEVEAAPGREPRSRSRDRPGNFWTRVLEGALRDDLGPVLVFAPHRKVAEKIARDVAANLPCPEPLGLTRGQAEAAGPELARLLTQRVAFHHSGLSYAQRAGVIEPLAKAGQLRVVVATLGLAAGINFSLRSVLVTGTQYNVDGFPREVEPAALLQMFGRAGRRGLDERGYVLVTDRTPRLGQARAERLRRAAPLPWQPLLARLEAGEAAAQAAPDFRRRLFTEAPAPLGNEFTAVDDAELPCGVRTDTGRARLVRRDLRGAQEGPRRPRARRGRRPRRDDRPNHCVSCAQQPTCLELDPAPTLLWLWNRLGMVDKQLRLTRRGRLMCQFTGPEGLGVLAGVEDKSYDLEELVFDLGDLVSGGRFAGEESRFAGRLAEVCARTYRRLSYEGFLDAGVPVNYGTGGGELLRRWREKGFVPKEALGEHAKRGDLDRLLIEWRSLLRQIVGGHVDEAWPRWRALQRLAERELTDERRDALPSLPELTAQQRKPVSHRLYTRG
ncbi:MAG: DEAD/DEAH box helicase [Verrucomicrobiota bacterium]